VTVTSAFARVVQRSQERRDAQSATVEHCDLCALEIRPEHRHVLDTDSGSLLCACQACALLFERDAAALGHYRLVPRRRDRLDIETSPAEVGVPVGLAFFVRRIGGSVVAFYPSPIGMTQWEVDADRWERMVVACPPVARLRPEVEAFLVDTARGANEHWIVGIDDCYRLAAVIRREWRGLSGGSTVWPAVAEFFRALSNGRNG
jgi:hypothetical protein